MMVWLMEIGMETGAAAVFLLPVLLFLNQRYFHNGKRCLCQILFCLYLSAAAVFTGLPSVNYLRFDVNLNLVPFLDMAEDGINSILNVLLFVPLGIFLPVLWKRYSSVKRCILFGFLLSLFIELSQLFTYRATDVNDLITNTVGTAVGWVIAKVFVKDRLKLAADGKKEAVLLCLLVFFVMFFLQPFLSSLFWNWKYCISP